MVCSFKYLLNRKNTILSHATPFYLNEQQGLVVFTVASCPTERLLVNFYDFIGVHEIAMNYEKISEVQ